MLTVGKVRAIKGGWEWGLFVDGRMIARGMTHEDAVWLYNSVGQCPNCA